MPQVKLKVDQQTSTHCGLNTSPNMFKTGTLEQKSIDTLSEAQKWLKREGVTETFN